MNTYNFNICMMIRDRLGPLFFFWWQPIGIFSVNFSSPNETLFL